MKMCNLIYSQKVWVELLFFYSNSSFVELSDHHKVRVRRIIDLLNVLQIYKNHWWALLVLFLLKWTCLCELRSTTRNSPEEFDRDSFLGVHDEYWYHSLYLIRILVPIKLFNFILDVIRILVHSFTNLTCRKNEKQCPEAHEKRSQQHHHIFVWLMESKRQRNCVNK